MEAAMHDVKPSHNRSGNDAWVEEAGFGFIFLTKANHRSKRWIPDAGLAPGANLSDRQQQRRAASANWVLPKRNLKKSWRFPASVLAPAAVQHHRSLSVVSDSFLNAA